jgi:hypothetical protein
MPQSASAVGLAPTSVNPQNNSTSSCFVYNTVVVGATDSSVRFLIEGFLIRWTHESRRGIPQGPWASSYLGNVYLDQIDKGLIQSGYRFARFMDDFRIFCKTPRDARRAVLSLTELARELGLSIQSAKTHVLGRAQARKAWRGYQDWLNELEQDIREEVKAGFAGLSPYGSEEHVDPGLDDATASEEVVRHMFDLITAKPAYKLDRKGLRFVLEKLQEASDCYATDFCMRHLPELTDLAPAVAAYVSRCGSEAVFVRIAEFISSDELMYDWQAAHLIHSVSRVADVGQKLV